MTFQKTSCNISEYGRLYEIALKPLLHEWGSQVMDISYTHIVNRAIHIELFTIVFN